MKTNIKNQSPIRRLNLALSIMVVATFLLRLIFANMAAAQTNDIADQADQMKQTQLDNEQLQLTVAELRSIERLNQVSAEMNLVPSQKIVYVRARGSVAFNR